MKATINDLKKIRNYFGEHDKSPFEHWACEIINSLIKDISVPLYSVEQIRNAGKIGEISSIDVEHLINILNESIMVNCKEHSWLDFAPCPICKSNVDRDLKLLAIDFAVYATDNAWFNYDSLLWELFDEDADPFRYSSEELYDKFLKERETDN